MGGCGAGHRGSADRGSRERRDAECDLLDLAEHELLLSIGFENHDGTACSECPARALGRC
jgi:hypothetical protein